jgi:hypothetical protein
VTNKTATREIWYVCVFIIRLKNTRNMEKKKQKIDTKKKQRRNKTWQNKMEKWEKYCKVHYKKKTERRKAQQKINCSLLAWRRGFTETLERNKQLHIRHVQFVCSGSSYEVLSFLHSTKSFHISSIDTQGHQTSFWYQFTNSNARNVT